MSFVTYAAIATLAGIGIKGAAAVGSGLSARKSNTKKAADIADQIKADDEALLRRETTSQFTLATQNMIREGEVASSTARDSLMKTFREKNALIQKSGGIANIGEVDAMGNEAYASVRSQNKYALDKLEDQYTGAITGIDIARERSLAGINERFNARIAEIGTIPDTFIEGIFGSNQRISGRDDLYV